MFDGNLLADTGNMGDAVPEAKYDDEGFRLKPDGTRDGRQKYSIHQPRPAYVKRPKAERLEQEVFKTEQGNEWEFVSEGFSRDGMYSVSGHPVKRFVVVRSKVTGQELLVGRGEAVKYAKVELPKKRRGRPVSNFRDAFADADDFYDIGPIPPLDYDEEEETVEELVGAVT